MKLKREKTRAKPQVKTPKHVSSLPEVLPLVPQTANQGLVIDSFREGKHVVIHGLAGTGKSFVACSLALAEVFKGNQDRLVIYRSAVPTRDVGFLKGTLEDKEAPYEAPYKSIFAEVFGRGDAYDILKKSGVVEFSTSSYLRGLTLRDSVIVVDEMQNWSFHELDSLITRLGVNSRVIFCGDYTQSDLLKHSEKEGLLSFLKILRSMEEFSFVEMGVDDIVRSALVKAYIVAKTRTSTP